MPNLFSRYAGMPNLFSSKSKTKRQNEAHDRDYDESMYTSGMKYVHENLIGNHAMVQSPFGDKRMTYADYTASGRNLYMIENYISKYVLGYYGNTHTSTSFASMQTGRFRDDSKDIIRRCVNASADDAVIFCGSGATAAIHKLIGVLGLNEPSIGSSTVVLVGPYEHHSNILPWKETGATLIRINEDRKGQFDMAHLERELKNQASVGEWKMLVGTFSACSNVTGLLVNTNRVTELMHLYGGLAFWDYAAGAPYLPMDMNPRSDSSKEGAAYKDGMFCSPHKFVGGPGSPGLLVAKKRLFTNAIPHGTGGGTVVYVSKKKHSYTKDVESREEGGTPGIIEAIRAGLVFQLKSSLGLDNIQKRETYLARKGINQLHGNPNIILLGSKVSPRVPILSFAVRHPVSKKLVHHNFIALLLSDLFGIQARGGCACAGPYAQDLLGIAEDVAEGIMAFLDVEMRPDIAVSSKSGTTLRMDQSIRIANSLGIMKPGFTRLNLAYFMPDDEIDFILSAINIVANEGWKLLPQYSYNAEHGSWHHRSRKNVYNLMSLNDITYNYGDEFHMVVKGNINPRSEPGKRQTFTDVMKKAERIIESADVIGRKLYPFDETTMKEHLPEGLMRYIWWLEPQHAMLFINHQSTKSLTRMRNMSIPLRPRLESGPMIGSPSFVSHHGAFLSVNDIEVQQQRSTGRTSRFQDKVSEWMQRASSDRHTAYTDETTLGSYESKDLLVKTSSGKRLGASHRKRKTKERRESTPVAQSKDSKTRSNKTESKPDVFRVKSKRYSAQL